MLANAGDTGSIPGSGRPPGGGNGYPLQYSRLGNSKDRGAWRGEVHGVTKELDHTFHMWYFEFCKKNTIQSILWVEITVKLFLTDEVSWRRTYLGKCSHDGLVSRKALWKDHRLNVVLCEFSWIIKVHYPLRRNGVAITVNKRVQNAVLDAISKNYRMISVRFQGKPYNAICKNANFTVCYVGSIAQKNHLLAAWHCIKMLSLTSVLVHKHPVA